MAVLASHFTPLDGTAMHLWDSQILDFSASYWEGKILKPDPDSTLADQRFYKQASQQARMELQRRKVTEILTR